MLLELTEVDTYYGRAQALHRISFTVDEGEIVTLLGANGAGKSTTLLTISGILRSRRGTIFYRGKSISRQKAGAIVKSGVSHCPEGRALFPDMTVLDNLKLGAYLRRDRDGIAQDLERVYGHFPRLFERKGQMAGSLSGGEQQMLAIGRSLMSRPTLLLLDEPSLGLSPILVEEMFKIIEDINREGMAVLLVEQNVAAALEVARRGYVLETGKMVFSGNREELMNNDQVRRAYLGG
ncbi:MAG TPA: ABC transporter ATP-binding protein [Thermodesulfobacteriota bacterium]|nr:ABC transporter ATP-binding protein [Thermodesulfobacteriota bacterium]